MSFDSGVALKSQPTSWSKDAGGPNGTARHPKRPGILTGHHHEA